MICVLQNKYIGEQEQWVPTTTAWQVILKLSDFFKAYSLCNVQKFCIVYPKINVFLNYRLTSIFLIP